MLYYFNTATAIKNSALFHLLPCQCAPCDWLKPFLEPLLARQELLLVVVLEEAAVALPPRRSQVYWQPTAPSPSRIVHDGLLLALYDFQQHDGRTDACANYFGYDTASTIVHCTTTNQPPATYWAILRQSLSKWRTPRIADSAAVTMKMTKSKIRLSALSYLVTVVIGVVASLALSTNHYCSVCALHICILQFI